MKKVNLSKYLHLQQVDNDIYIGWNRFFPSIFILNTPALELLDTVKKGVVSEKIEYYLKEFKKYKFIYEGEIDPSQTDFLDLVQQNLDRLDREAGDFYRLEKDYQDLRVLNDRCNLRCPYCVNRNQQAPKAGTGIKKDSPDRNRVINNCIDQFFARKMKNGVKETSVSFNGGEILTDWTIIKDMVQRISQKYPDIKVQYEINTNLTLLTEEIARFFDFHKFKVHISIDGYKESHDKTRKYPDGRGSFDDIIKKVELFRKINKNNPLVSFQGTIENSNDFIPEKVYEMDKYGFLAARLAPNLLNAPEQEGIEKAQLMGKFLELNSQHQFQVKELIFTQAKKKINQNKYRFSFNCPGLRGPPKMPFEINITTLSISHLCGFIQDAAVPFQDLGYDIYNPILWDVSFQFIKERMARVRENCLECPLVALCLGGCILSGLDAHNRLNKAACAYQQEIWNIYLKKVYQDRKKKK